MDSILKRLNRKGLILMTADTTWVELPDSRYPILFEAGSLSDRASAPTA